MSRKDFEKTRSIFSVIACFELKSFSNSATVIVTTTEFTSTEAVTRLGMCASADFTPKNSPILTCSETGTPVSRSRDFNATAPD